MEGRETKLCKKCRMEIAKDAKVCPHCRKGQGLGVLAWVGIGFVILTIIGMTAGGGQQAPAASATPVDQAAAVSAPATPSVPDLEMLTSEVKKGEYSRSIVGQVRNNSDKTLSYAQISFNLYDDSGAQVGSALANINNLEAGAVWNYDAMILDDKATTYKFMEVTGF